MSVELRSAIAGLGSGAGMQALADALAARDGLGSAALDALRATPAGVPAASVATSRPADAPQPIIAARAGAPEAPADTSTAAAAPAPPTEEARGRETVIVPAQVSAFHGEAARAAARREFPGEARPQRQRRSFDRGGSPSGRDGDAAADDDDDAAAEAPEPDQPAALPVRRRRDDSTEYRAITSALHAAVQTAALRELAHGRRIWVASPRVPRAGRASNELLLRLLGRDARGEGQVRVYRARGQRAANERSASAWCSWRIHRDVGADGEPRIVAGNGRALPPQPGAALALRLARGRLAAPLRDASTAWLDMLDVQRLLGDLGSQWCVTLVWAPQPVGSSS